MQEQQNQESLSPNLNQLKQEEQEIQQEQIIIGSLIGDNCFLGIPALKWDKTFEDYLNQKISTLIFSEQGAQLSSGLYFFIKGLCYEYGKGVAKNFEKAKETYEKGFQAMDPLCAFRLAEIYNNQQNTFKVETNFENTWYYLIIAYSLFPLTYSYDIMHTYIYMEKIIQTADETLQNSKDRLTEGSMIQNKDIINLLILMFEFRHLTSTTQDDQAIQIKYDEICKQLQQNIINNMISEISYYFLFRFAILESNNKDKRIGELLDHLVNYPQYLAGCVYLINNDIEILALASKEKQIASHTRYCCFEAYHIRQVMGNLRDMGISIFANNQKQDWDQNLKEIDKLLYQIFYRMYQMIQNKILPISIEYLQDVVFTLRNYARILMKSQGLEKPDYEQALQVSSIEYIKLNADYQMNYSKLGYICYMISQIKAKMNAPSQEIEVLHNKAYELFKKRLENEKNDNFIQLMANYYLGRIEYKKQNLQQAKAYYQEAVDLYNQPNFLNARTFQFEMLYRKAKSKLKKNFQEDITQINENLKKSHNAIRQQTYEQFYNKITQQPEEQSPFKGIDLQSSIMKVSKVDTFLQKSIIKKGISSDSTQKPVSVNMEEQKEEQGIQFVFEQTDTLIPFTDTFQNLSEQKRLQEENLKASGHEKKSLLLIKHQQLKDLVQIDINEIQFLSLLRKGETGNSYIVKIDGEYYAAKMISFLNNVQFEHLRSSLKKMLRVNHPHILNYLAYSLARPKAAIDEGINIYFISELKETNLRNLILQSPKQYQDFNQKLQIALQIGKGLLALHNCQEFQIHGNLKDSNILLNSTYQVFISDWPFYVLLGNDYFIDDTSEMQNCNGFKAPEQILNVEIQRDSFNPNTQITNKIDVWAFGIILYQIFFNFRPIEEEMNQIQLYKKGVNINDDYSAYENGTYLNMIRDLINTMLVIEPSSRQLLNNCYDALKQISIETQKQ